MRTILFGLLLVAIAAAATAALDISIYDTMSRQQTGLDSMTDILSKLAGDYEP